MTDEEQREQQRKELEKLGVRIIEAPMLTEDGFINPVFEAELEGAINNAWADATRRCEEDPEWNTPRWTMWREVTGYFALWAVRQIESPDTTPFPPGLEKMIGYLSACTRSKFDEHEMAELSLCQIERMLEEILWPMETFQSWNDRDVLPGWLDLYALLRNVCCSIRNERREFDRFNREFDAANAEFGFGEGI
jgi:hypothetical protein